MTTSYPFTIYIPAVIVMGVSHDSGYAMICMGTGNQYSPTVIVAAMSGRIKGKTELPTHYKGRPYAGLDEESLVLLEQIRTIDKKRLKKYIGQLGQADEVLKNREKSSEISAYLKNAFNCERSVVESILRLSVDVLQDLNFFGVRV